MTTKLKFLFASLALASITTLSAQTVGYVTKTIAQNQQAAFSLIFESTPATFTGSTAGVITSVASNQLTCSTAAWATNFATAAQPYFVQITSGTASGALYRIATANNTATTLNLTSVISTTPNINTRGIVAGTDTFKIIEGKTLKTLFASQDIFGTGSAATADVIYVNNDGTWQSFFYNSTLVTPQWRPTSGAPVSQDNFVIGPQAGFLYLRRGSTALNLVLSGVVPDQNLNTPVNNIGNTMISGAFPVDSTLGASNLQNTPGWVSASGSITKANADKVYIYTTSWSSYVYDSVDSRWEPTGPNINSNGVIITAGTPILVTKAAGGSAGAQITTRNKPY